MSIAIYTMIHVFTVTWIVCLSHRIRHKIHRYPDDIWTVIIWTVKFPGDIWTVKTGLGLGLGFLLGLELGLGLVLGLELVFGLGLLLVMTVRILTVQILTVQIKTGNQIHHSMQSLHDTTNRGLLDGLRFVLLHCWLTNRRDFPSDANSLFWWFLKQHW